MWEVSGAGRRASRPEMSGSEGSRGLAGIESDESACCSSPIPDSMILV